MEKLENVNEIIKQNKMINISPNSGKTNLSANQTSTLLPKHQGKKSRKRNQKRKPNTIQQHCPQVQQKTPDTANPNTPQSHADKKKSANTVHLTHTQRDFINDNTQQLSYYENKTHFLHNQFDSQNLHYCHTSPYINLWNDLYIPQMWQVRSGEMPQYHYATHYVSSEPMYQQRLVNPIAQLPMNLNHSTTSSRPSSLSSRQSFSDVSLNSDCSDFMDEKQFSEKFERIWFEKTSPDQVLTKSSTIPIRICSYNVLAQPYATQQAFPYCALENLEFSYRSSRLINDIINVAADILCLQEVTGQTYSDLFKPQLEKLGYGSEIAFKNRASIIENGGQVDGCSVFWNKERFKLIDKHVVSFSKLALQYHHIAPDFMLNRLHPRDNVAILLVLECLDVTEKNQYVLVACSHLHWDPAYEDVKLMQSVILMKEIDNFVRTMKQKLVVNEIPMFIAGDFNSTPDSAVYEYLTRGEISINHPDLRHNCDMSNGLLTLANSPALDCISGFNKERNIFTHDHGLDSACTSKDLTFTNYTMHFCGIIDHIFASREYLTVKSVLGIDDVNLLVNNFPAGAPNEKMPSDHLPIAAEFYLNV